MSAKSIDDEFQKIASLNNELTESESHCNQTFAKLDDNLYKKDLKNYLSALKQYTDKQSTMKFELEKFNAMVLDDATAYIEKAGTVIKNQHAEIIFLRGLCIATVVLFTYFLL